MLLSGGDDWSQAGPKRFLFHLGKPCERRPHVAPPCVPTGMRHECFERGDYRKPFESCAGSFHAPREIGRACGTTLLVQLADQGGACVAQRCDAPACSGFHTGHEMLLATDEEVEVARKAHAQRRDGCPLGGTVLDAGQLRAKSVEQLLDHRCWDVDSRHLRDAIHVQAETIVINCGDRARIGIDQAGVTHVLIKEGRQYEYALYPERERVLCQLYSIGYRAAAGPDD